ncbi:Fem1b, partial [Symbiodinium microadriaticum]
PQSTPALCQASLYQVSSGFAPMRHIPNLSVPGVGLLKGGHRFFAVPYRVDGFEWLRLEKDAAAPLFSSRGFAESRGKHDSKLEEMYWRSLPSLAASSPALLDTEDVWIRNEVKTVRKLRDARAMRLHQEPEIPEVPSPRHILERASKASRQIVKRVKEPMAHRSQKEWVQLGGGGWCNIGEYGVARHSFRDPPGLQAKGSF